MPFRGLWNLLTAEGPGRFAAGVAFLALALAAPVLFALFVGRLLDRGG